MVAVTRKVVMEQDTHVRPLVLFLTMRIVDADFYRTNEAR